jgi:hypothetical protein
MIQYFAIRNAPPPDGEVIALWKKETPNLHLEVIGKEEWMSSGINTLITETTEEEFSVMDTICEIPHIQSDGVYHFLGELEFKYKPKFSFPKVAEDLLVKTKVHAVVVDLDDSTISRRFITNDNTIGDAEYGGEIPDVIMAEPYEEPDSIP